MKTRGEDEPFTEVTLEEVEKTEKLPGIDMSVDWKRREEMPHWRRTSPVIREVRLKSLGEGGGGGRMMDGSQAKVSGRKDTSKRRISQVAESSSDSSDANEKDGTPTKGNRN